MAVYIANAFSLGMLPETGADLRVRPVDPVAFLAQDPEGGQVESVVGHADTARLFSNLLGREVAFNRATLRLSQGDRVLVGQYRGPRLPEGATELPEGAAVLWYLVEVVA